MEGAQALIRAREEFKGIVDVQVVAFAQDGIVREPGAADLVRQAMALGADVVGGIPWIEYTDAHVAQHVKEIFDIAQEYNKDVSMLVDDAGDPGLRSLELMAVETIQRGWHGRSLAHHARAMALYPKPYFQKVAALLKQARMGVVSDPHTGRYTLACTNCSKRASWSAWAGRHLGCLLSFGRNHMLEVAFLACHLLWMTTSAQMETLYDMITLKPAQAMGLREFGLKVGAPAHLVVLDVPTFWRRCAITPRRPTLSATVSW